MSSDPKLDFLYDTVLKPQIETLETAAARGQVA